MYNGFLPIKPEQIDENVFKLLHRDWMLITAGKPGKYNTMTASWGGFGVLWEKKIALCVVRPHRYTFEFMENEDHYTLSFFDGKYRAALNFCGANSGRDVDKAAATGLTAAGSQAGPVYFEEAKLVLECRKLYFQDMNPDNFQAPELHTHYPKKDYHRMYFGEITGCFKRG